MRAIAVIWTFAAIGAATTFTSTHLDGLRNQTVEMFFHGWDNYMKVAFPHDEVRPITCKPLFSDDPDDVQMNDVLGGYSLTMLDTLDMFAMMNDTDRFHNYIDLVINQVDFNVDSTVQVFETTIRAMGGLLSAHLYASVDRLGQAKPDYHGELLDLAYSLGKRLLPAFDTPTGIPHPRVNLQRGIVPVNGKMVDETCASGAGSLLLEFGMLSRLTGDQRFEFAARRAFLELWSRRSSLDLVPMSIDSKTGYWLDPITGVGASIDSLYEYAVKYYVLFGDDQFWTMFERMDAALSKHSFDGWNYKNINFRTGAIMTPWVDSLAAFFPGLQVLAGNLGIAVRMHLAYYKLWVTYGGNPERWSSVFDLRTPPSLDLKGDPVSLEWWPLRPEFIESNYHLYQATKDPFYLQVGKGVMKDIDKNCRVKCGFAGIQDVRTGQLTDRMESFFLSETLKYLYLLFTPSHPLNTEFSNFVISTEAHPMWYDKDVIRQASVLRFDKLGHEISADPDTITTSHLEHPSIFKRIWDSWFAKKRRKKLKNSTCQAWTHDSRRMDSMVASWDHFYSLNEAFNFTQPRWLTKLAPNRTAFELEPQFYHAHVFPASQCAAPEDPAANQTLAVSFETVNAATIRKPIYERKNTIGFKSLDGLTCQFTKFKHDGLAMYKVDRLNSLEINDRMVELAMLFESVEDTEFIGTLTDGTVTINQTPVINARVVV